MRLKTSFRVYYWEIYKYQILIKRNPAGFRVTDCYDMRKLLLALTILMTASVCASAQEGGFINFSYAGKVETAQRLMDLQKDAYIYQAFEFPGELLKSYSGSKITRFYMHSPYTASSVNPNTEITMFLSHGLNEQPFYTQDAKIAELSYTQNMIPLSEPYTLEADKALYVGFKMKNNDPKAYYIVVDNVPNSNQSCLLGRSDNGGWPSSWANQSSNMGAICMGCILEGETLPLNLISTESLTAPQYVMAGQDAVFQLAISNNGANAIKSLDLKVSARGEEAYTITVPVEPALENRESTAVPLTVKAFATSGTKDVEVSVEKVNGAVPSVLPASQTASTLCIEQGYPRRLVVEEGTGTWCGWCPSGIVCLDYLKEKYENVYVVAVHFGSDPMKVESYMPWVDKYSPNGAAPMMMLNRLNHAIPIDGKTIYDNLIDLQIANPSYAKATINGGKLSEDESTVTFDTEYEFGIDGNSHFRVSVALVEDGIGPFNQSNYYNGGAYGDMDGWGSKGDQVKTIYNDVARGLSNFPGENCFPVRIAKGEKYTAEISMNDISKVNSDKFRAILMITDALTGEILNADMKEFEKSKMKDNAVTSVIADTLPESVYTLDGVKVARAADGSLPAGIYVIVRGGKASKVLVR